MLNENNCNGIAITDLLKIQHPLIAKHIEEVCVDTGVSCTVIEKANDFWCRDFMPLQVTPTRSIQFAFNPTYYRSGKFRHLKTNIDQVKINLNCRFELSEIVLDGGNICYFDDVAIITEKVFEDNPLISKETLCDKICELLELEELTVIPVLPYDITGHADGMIKFIDKKTILLNDFRLISGKTFWNKLLKALRNFQIILLPNDLHLNAKPDDATGDYINMVCIKNHLIVPAYKKPTDKLAHKIIELSFPHYKMSTVVSNSLASYAGVLHCATWNYYA